jgi:hypothetical protein
MAFNINEIRANLQFGGARPTLFDVVIALPNTISGDLSRLQFLCSATSLPATELGMIQVPYFGRKYKIAGDRTFAPWQVTILNDEDFTLRDTFENWNYQINLFQGNIQNAGSGRPGDYKSTALVTQYSKQGEPIRQYTFEGIFPETVTAIDLDWNANDTIEQFQVQFQYDFFAIDGSTASDFTQ